MFRQMVNGFCMALADSVPGVSGGTIAFIMGFYDQFIGSIHNIVFGNKQEKGEALRYLLKLGVGWIVGMVSAILVLTSIFESHIYVVSSLFIGFIICAIPVIMKEERESLVGHHKSSIFLFLGILLVVMITYLNSFVAKGGMDLATLSVGKGIYLFVAGMVAISAMFLPGISGSTLLLIFGLYVPVLTAVKEVLHLQFAYIPALCIFALGIVIGAMTVVKGIKVCLDKFRSQTVFAILGMMIGSIYAIVMGPTTLDIPQPAMSFDTFHFIACIVGGVLIVVLQMGQNREMNVTE